MSEITSPILFDAAVLYANETADATIRGDLRIAFVAGAEWQWKRDAALSAENERLRKALEWALDRATDSDHPHYPARGESSAWVYPYLVSGTPFGGGVGEAGFSSALEAVEAAMVETRS